jgi:hypothetical protein
MRRRINLTKEKLSRFFVKLRRMYLRKQLNTGSWIKKPINNEFD